MALGARGGDVRLMVLAQSSRITIVATVVGVALAVGLGRVGEAMLFGVTALDARAQAGAAGLMLAVAPTRGRVAGAPGSRNRSGRGAARRMNREPALSRFARHCRAAGASGSRLRSPMFETLRQDVRHGARILMRDPRIRAGRHPVHRGRRRRVRDHLQRRRRLRRSARCRCRVRARSSQSARTTPADRGNGTPLSHPDFADLRGRRPQFQRRFGPSPLLTSFALRREDQAISGLGFAVSGNLLDVLKCARNSAGSSSPKRIGCRASTRSR